MEGISVDEARRKGVCLRCGQPGHLARQCQEAKKYVREMYSSLSPEDKHDLAEAVAETRKSEFVGVEDAGYVQGLSDNDSFSTSEQ